MDVDGAKKGTENTKITIDETSPIPISDVECWFLGTSSASPTRHRNVQSTALRMDGDIWLIDCGEGTQHQILRCALKPGRVQQIFITHLHGDHVFGLPGLICSISHNQSISGEKATLAFWGPPGLRKYIRDALVGTKTHLTIHYVVNELHPDGIVALQSDSEERRHFDELQGLDILPDKDSNGVHWTLLDMESRSPFIVKAASISHSNTRCFGYTFAERPTAGTINPAKLLKCGLKPGPICKRIKLGETVRNDEGDEIHPEDVLDSPTPGRKVTIGGDMSNGDNLVPLAQNSDLVVHECTYGHFYEKQAVKFGHSTSKMAADFARRSGASMLVLTHFSARYQSEAERESILPNLTHTLPQFEKMVHFGNLHKVRKENPDVEILKVETLVEEAKEEYLPPNGVFAASDLMVIPIERKNRRKRVRTDAK